VLEINRVDPEITFATLPENTWVRAGRMVATIKIIPYAVAGSSLSRAVQVANGKRLSVVEPEAKKVCLIQTRLPSIKPSVLDKTRRVTDSRLQARGAEIVSELRCQHSEKELTEILLQSIQASTDWILIVGASAISDRRDVIPAAVEAAGGTVHRYGLPVDPGNLLMLGELRGRIVLGLPGCARSPKYNGLDHLLDRMACDVEIDDNWLNSLAVGGLLVEELDRPQPRVSINRKPTVAAIVLAAGMSRRMGDINKLLQPVSGAPMVRQVVQSVCKSRVSGVLVVTGHEQEKIAAALHDLDVDISFNPQYEQGMGHSLSHGISRLEQADAVGGCLGDMPMVGSEIIDRLIEQTGDRAGAVIAVPVMNGVRGNPVLVGRLFFDTLLQHGGDSGARFLMKQYPDKVLEVEIADDAIHRDFDTPQALQELGES